MLIPQELQLSPYTYIKQGKFELIEKPKPELKDTRDAIVRVTLSSICTSDLHIKHGGVPRAVPGVTIGHEMVGVVEQTGADVTLVKPGDRVVVNVETFCGKCFFCQHGYVNNCIDPNGGWALGCRIDGGQTEYVRVPYADQGLSLIPETVTDEQALFVGDILATGFWAARISEITEEACVHRILLVRAESVGGLHDDRDFLVFSADDLRSIQSVHHRHFDVHQDRFGLVAVFLEQCHDFFAILGPLYITFLSDDCFDQFEVAVVVLGH